MAEPPKADAQGSGEQKAKKGLFSTFRIPFMTNIKRFYREVLGFPTHDVNETGIRNMRVFIDLKDELRNFVPIKTMNERMVEIEAQWDGIVGDDDSTSKSAAGLRDKIIEKFSAGAEQDESSFTSSIGPFTDIDALKTEANWASNGTEREEKTFTIRKFNQDLPFKFKIPNEQKITFNDGWREYELAFFGYARNEYWDELKKTIEHIGEEIIRRHRSQGGLTPDQIRNAEVNIAKINETVIAFIDSVALWSHEFELRHYNNLGASKGIIKHYEEIENLKTQLKNKRLTFDQVYYQHTYRIVKSVIYENNDPKKPKHLKDVQGWYKRDDEEGDGLDKNGWPLEVGDGDRLFRGQPLEEGIVLLDLYNENDKEYQKLQKAPKIRKVPKEFITDCSLLDMAVWIYVSFDAYRDDLRDGRYHPKAITVMERILQDITPKQMHFDIPKKLLTGQHIKTKMGLNVKKLHGTGPKLRPDTDPNEVDQIIEATSFNPCYDVGAFELQNSLGGKPMAWSKHMGRKLYYDVQDNTEPSDEPTITTRGAAMYILHRLIERAKYWEGKGDEKYAGIMELIDFIGKEIGGWDIGPNLGPNFSRWGKPLTKNPFKPQQSS